jgi:mRNA interferase MazF
MTSLAANDLAAGNVVWVPFPHVEDGSLHPRPALIVATGLGPAGTLCWALMITNARRQSWPGDVAIGDHAAVGLPIPSKVRTAKIATLESRDAHWLGRLADEDWRTVSLALRQFTERAEPNQ